MIYKSPRFSKEKNYTINNFAGIDNSSDTEFAKEGSLNEGYNLWNKDYSLSTRPGIIATTGGEIISDSYYTDSKKIYYANFPFDDIPGYNRLCALCQEMYSDRTLITFFVIDSNGRTHYLLTHEMLGAMPMTSYEIKNILFIKDKPISGSGIFVLIPFIKHEPSTDSQYKDVLYYELSEDFHEIKKINPLNFHRPLIVKNGRGNRAPTETLKNCPQFYPEGPNILGGGFQAGFTCDGYSFNFVIPTTIAESATVEVRFYTSETNYLTFYIPPGELNSEQQPFEDKQLWVALHRGTGILSFMRDSTTFSPPRIKANNGIMVYAYSDTVNAAYEMLSSNATPISFDGRLFIPGGENRGNKIYYSGKNLPLYYSEKNSITVGNTNYNITALSLQSKYVIAFKQQEIYRLSLNESEDANRNLIMTDMITGIIPTPTCKTTKINDTIGCDLPATIVNCANRLVWFHTNGVVYTLYGSNLYSEGSVYELSGGISNFLKSFSEEDLSLAFATELNGFYALGINKKLFMMDVRTSGFRYLSGYKNKTDNHGGLPWFCWNAPKDTAYFSAFTINSKEFFIMRDYADKNFYVASPNGITDMVINGNEQNEYLPEFSMVSTLFGKNNAIVSLITLNAVAHNAFTVEIYDQNGTIKTVNFSGEKKQRQFKIPLSYKMGKVGIKIKGSGYFSLKDISYSITERVY